jgi:phage-related protein
MQVYTNAEIEKFTQALQAEARAKVARTIELLETFGHTLTFPHSKKVTKDLFELKIKGRQEIRIFYTFDKNSAYLLHDFVKKQQKIPQKELKQALKKLNALTQYNI